ncbi:hypothetical protein HDV00_003472 [Rhizophlyctis rosea]|nr:hypothetical protein HDV00_003472 [Rhizophlyctis rosea]
MPILRNLPKRLATRQFHTSTHLRATLPLPPSSIRKSTTYPYELNFISTTKADPQALTFLPSSALSKPGHLQDVGIIGWIPVTATEVKPDNFRENPIFEDFLHSWLRDNIESDDFTKALATHQQIGYLNINDSRVYTAWGRVSDPEDILGSVRLDNGQIVKGSYER